MVGGAWKDNLQKQLITELGAKPGAALFAKYANAFPSNYCEECSVEIAVADVKQIETLSIERPVDINIYRFSDDDFHLRLYQIQNPIPLSDILPMLENLDLRTFNERPYKITTPQGVIWISDFCVAYKNPALDIDKVKKIFQDVFINTNAGLAENDGFNKLALGAQLSWREIIIVRAYAKYLRQPGFRFSQAYIELALANNPLITTELINLFVTKFDPTLKTRNIAEIEAKIVKALDDITSLDEDRIIRRLLDLIKATLRTNYFQLDANQQPKAYLSFKLDSGAIPELPLPVPLYEIFVYAPRFEGIHLRNAKVARGGIRWSDRREDFRTEV